MRVKRYHVRINEDGGVVPLIKEDPEVQEAKYGSFYDAEEVKAAIKAACGDDAQPFEILANLEEAFGISLSD